MHTQDAIQIDPVHNAGLCIRIPYNCASNHSTHRTPEHVKNKNGTSKRTEQGRLTHGRQKGKKKKQVGHKGTDMVPSFICQVVKVITSSMAERPFTQVVAIVSCGEMGKRNETGFNLASTKDGDEDARA